MKNKFISWLSLMAVFIFILQSCVHDEMYSASDPASKEYNSKSLWKEDETYIKNVRDIFLKNANFESFKNNHGGLPQWDYAMTFGNFDESYLMVPILGQQKVTGIMTVKRIEDRIYFKFSEDEDAKSFFADLIFPKNKKLSPVNEIAENAKLICSTRTYQICFPNNDGTEDCYSQTVVKCISEENIEDNDIGGDNTGNGMPYGGGSNTNPQPETPKTPCEKAKEMHNDPEIKAKTNTLYDQSKKTGVDKGEKGFMVKPDGTDGPIIPGGEHSVQLGDLTGYQGYYHNHTPAGVKMLSPPDIYKLFQFIVSQPAGTPVDASFGAMVAAQEKCWTCPDHYLYFTYMIRFNGTFEDAKAINDRNYTEDDLKALKNSFEKFEQGIRNESEYTSQDGNFMNFKGLEEVFFNGLDEMKIDKSKIILQRIDKNGNVTNISAGPDGKPQEVPCP